MQYPFSFWKVTEATRIVAFTLASLMLAGCQRVVGSVGTHEARFDGASALADVETQMAFGDRYPGSAGHADMQAWIEASLDERGWRVERQDFTFAGVALRNLVGRRGRDGEPLIVLGAHYDTRPIADQDAEVAARPVPGANDGASGTAVLLELARVLPSGDLACDVRLAFFDAEDSGGIAGWDWILGSRHFADTLADSPQAVVIVDMVGDRDLRLPRERNSAPNLVDAIWSAARQTGSEAFVDDMGPGMLDDHTPFLERGWPAVDIIDFEYPYWHTAQDTLDKVSAESLDQVGRTLLFWLTSVCGR
jgi:hypothetical protein